MAPGSSLVLCHCSVSNAECADDDNRQLYRSLPVTARLEDFFQ